MKLRPAAVADGLPFVGESRVCGLYVNAGHDHHGWTLAVGSAKLIADAVERRKPDIDPIPYDPSR